MSNESRVCWTTPTWPEVFAGDSPYGGLLGPHLTRMEERYVVAVKRELAEDPDFDSSVESGQPS